MLLLHCRDSVVSCSAVVRPPLCSTRQINHSLGQLDTDTALSTGIRARWHCFIWPEVEKWKICSPERLCLGLAVELLPRDKLEEIEWYEMYPKLFKVSWLIKTLVGIKTVKLERLFFFTKKQIVGMLQREAKSRASQEDIWFKSLSKSGHLPRSSCCGKLHNELERRGAQNCRADSEEHKRTKATRTTL